jgi:CheY-like chemotaxis protein
MLDPEELRWIRSTANELNNLLQVITESSQFLQNFCEDNTDSHRYLAMLRSAVDRSAQVTRMMLERSGATMPEAMAIAGEPVAAPPKPEPPPPAAETSAQNGRIGDVNIANPNGQKELIMIVDDEDFVRVLAQRVLADEGYRIVTAKDGFSALDIYRKLKDQIGLVILDFTMPIMDGADVFNELRLINPRVPVVLSSGFTEQDKLKWMLARGLRGFIPKPYTQQKLLLQIRSTLDAIRREKED